MVLFTKTEFYQFYCIRTAYLINLFLLAKTFLVGLKPPFGNIFDHKHPNSPFRCMVITQVY